MNTLKWISAPQKLITLLVVSLLLSVSPAIACTNVQLNAADGSCVVSRTMDDNPAIMKIKVALTPRGKAIPPTNPDGSPRSFLYNELFELWPASDRFLHTHECHEREGPDAIGPDTQCLILSNKRSS